MATKPNSTLTYRRVPAFLKQIREEAGLTQRQLAGKIGRAQWWVARAEIGSRRVDVAEFVELCLACEVKPDDAIRRFVRSR